jgi:hypothetical protein
MEGPISFPEKAAMAGLPRYIIAKTVLLAQHNNIAI